MARMLQQQQQQPRRFVIVFFVGVVIYCILLRTVLVQQQQQTDDGSSSSSSLMMMMRWNNNNNNNNHIYYNNYTHYKDGGRSNRTKKLNNINIVMIGDSLMRYQYIHFVYYLHTVQWFNDKSKPNNNIIINEKTYTNWINFYNATNQNYDGYEICDCYRNETTIPANIYENRYYYNPISNNSITYIQKFGLLPSHGHWLPDDIVHKRQQQQTQQQQQQQIEIWNQPWQEPVWEYKNWDEIIMKHIAFMKPYRPKYLVFNAGLWVHDLHNRTILQQIQESCRKFNIITIYKTTSARSYENSTFHATHYPHDIVACSIMDICYNISWTAALNDGKKYSIMFHPDGRTNNNYNDNDYWDLQHFQARINQQFNEQLLSLLLKHQQQQQQNEGK